MTLIILSAASILLTSCFAVPMLKTDEYLSGYKALKEPTDPKYRLPDQGIDIQNYNIELTPHFNGTDAFTFDAKATITASVKVRTNKITLHAKHLTFKSVIIVFTNPSLSQIVNPIPAIDEKYDFWDLKLDRPLSPPAAFTIIVDYRGSISEDMQGLYRSSYEEQGQTKWLATTQLQPIHARRLFPCFDEPQYKSKFTLTIRRPKTFQPTLSNMKMNGNGTEGLDFYEEKFFETPKMSTYLVAFVVSEFETASKTIINDPDQFGVWARKEANDQGEFAFTTSMRIVETFEHYLMYPVERMNKNLKNDQVAIPDMRSGAMENWGIVTHREANLMYKEDESSVRDKQQVAVGLTHEIAHFWFGNLVTCQWWSELWLNEGFATYFHVFLTDMIETMDIATQFNVMQLQSVMLVDVYRNSPTLKNDEDKVNSPEEIQSQFNPIVYTKGAVVIRMARDLLGSRTFQNALINYLNETNFETANETTLFKFLQRQADNDKSLINYENTNVLSFMSSWTNFNGFPLLTVEIDREAKMILLNQERFMKSLDGEAPPTTWHIPITYTTKGESDFDNVKPKFIFTEKSNSFNERRINSDDWIIFNIQQSGYYRVLYDDFSLKLIINALQSKDREDINPQNRAQIVDDLFNFARENMYKYSDLLDAIQFLELESHFAPWSAAFAGFSYLRLLFQSLPELQKSFDKHILTTMNQTLLPKIQFDENISDKHIDKIFRINAYNLVCQIEYEECIKESKKLFKEFKDFKSPIPPNLREYVYCTALRHGSGEDFDVLWKKYLTENVMNEKNTILNALGCSPIHEKIIKFLYNTITQNSPMRQQEKIIAFNSVVTGGSSNVEIAFDFVQDNIKNIQLIYGSGSLKTIFENMAVRMSREQLEKFEQIINTEMNYLTEEEIGYAYDAIRNAKANINTADSLKEEFEKWLENKYSSANIMKASWSLMFTLFILNLCLCLQSQYYIK